MSEALSIAKTISQTIEECMTKLKALDTPFEKLKDTLEELAEKRTNLSDDIGHYIEEINDWSLRKTDSLESFKRQLQELLEFLAKVSAAEKKQSQNKKEQKKPEPKKEQKKQESKKEPKKEQEMPLFEDVPDLYDEEESEASDFDEKEKQAKKAQQKKPAEFIKIEPTPSQVQQKNEAFFQDVMRVLTDFTTKLESMLREHLEIKEEPKKEQPKKDEYETSSSGSTVSTIDSDN